MSKSNDITSSKFRKHVNMLANIQANNIISQIRNEGIEGIDVMLDNIGLKYRVYTAIMDSIISANSNMVSYLDEDVDTDEDTDVNTDEDNSEYPNNTILNNEHTGYNGENRCLSCNEDMGPSNPRQLCGKTHCRNY